jgi:hypothetical protein
MQSLINKHLCLKCVGEKHLKTLIRKSGSTAKCSYCGSDGKTYSTRQVADLIHQAFEEHYQHAHYDEMGNRGGEEVCVAIADAAGIEESPAEDIRSILADEHYDHELAKMGDECPYDKDSRYQLNRPNDIEYRVEWANLEKILKTETRFFSETARAVLGKVFAGLEGNLAGSARSVVVVGGIGKKLNALFRARVFQSEAKLLHALEHPDSEIGPPSHLLASAGRMNARGISVFYGATEPETALAELRPPVGSDVAIGKFTLIKDVKLLDITALAKIAVWGSIFDPAYLPKLERFTFLKSLSRRITRPILPDDEASEYIVTQVVADYLANVLKFDGIMYSSAQRKGGINVALFHHAAVTERYLLPKGTDVSAYAGNYGEDDSDRHFLVSEYVPEEIEKLEPESRSPKLHFLNRAEPQPEPYLKLDVESIYIHEVRAIRYKSVKTPVHRHRSIRSSSPQF